MKRHWGCLALVLIVVLCFTACGKTGTDKQKLQEQAENAEAELTASAEPYALEYEFLSVLEAKKLTAPVKELEMAALEWASTAVRFKYLGADPTYLNLVKKAVAVDTAYTELSVEFTLHGTLCDVDFADLYTYDNIEKLPDTTCPDDTHGYYRATVLVISVEQGGTATCIGIRHPGEYNKEEIAREVYACAARTQDYKLKPLPEERLPEGFTVVTLKEAIGKHSIYQYFALTDEVLAAGYYDQTDVQDTYGAGVVLFDRTGKLIKDVQIVDTGGTGPGFYVKEGKICTNIPLASLNGTQDTEDRYAVDSTGSVTKEAGAKTRYERLYSPDGKKCAYSGQNSLYVTDEKGTRLLFERKYYGEMVGNTYVPCVWITGNRLVYRVYSYDADNGCGVVNTDTGETIAWSYGLPIGVADGKLYSIAEGEGTSSVYAVDIDKPEEQPQRLVGNDESDMNMQVDASIRSMKIVCFTRSSITRQNKLAVYSLKDGAPLKECSFFQKDLSARAIMLDVNTVALFRDGEMILVDLTKLK